MEVMMAEDFRNYLRPLDDPKIIGSADLDTYQYLDRHRQWPDFEDALGDWRHRFEASAPFSGITSDGQVRQDLWRLRPEGAPNAAMVEAANALIGILDQEQRRVLQQPLNSHVWRAWMNPEFYVNRFGLRLDEVGQDAQEAALGLMQASLSAKGFSKVRQAMWTNAFLGDLTDKPCVFNEYSYNLNLFGEPSEVQPWGWNIYGHHVAMSVLVLGQQMVISPVFLGAEPNHVDAGPHRGVHLFRDQDQLALDLIRGLAKPLQQNAILFPDKLDPAIPPGRAVFGDELHLAGMFQDNRVIPYEGICVAQFPDGDKELLVKLAELFVEYLPDGPLQAQMDRIRAHLDETWLCWIGGIGDDDPFYFRIQSPVFLAEYEHHAGIVLTNELPAKFHTHTIVRTPNGNDYGAALIELEQGTHPTLVEAAEDAAGQM